ncbi:MAG TPA: hypothetical protein DCQ37_06765 [Desulfobacteraceae bacterium]|nr:hypothetical protein [Desulfobacteraceae bacterium]
MRSGLFLTLLYGIVFATGSAGLIYQVTWQRYLSRLFGSDSIATAIILATFLGGLSLGYYLCGRLTTKVKNHFKAYAILEGIIGGYGLLFPSIFKSINELSQPWSFSFPFLMIIQGFFCSAVLIGIPTICMGGTIPFLTRAISRNIGEATHVHANVYAINTAGAFIGTLIAGFYLIPAYGLPLTVMGTAFLNLAAFLFFYFVPNLESTEDISQIVEEDIYEPKFNHIILYLVAFLSGFYVMTLENVFIRLINLSLGSSSYSFSMIVSVFILSIAVGSYIVGKFNILSKKILYINQLCITILLFLIYFSLDTWTYWAHLIRIGFQSNEAGFWYYYMFIFIVLTVLLILPVGFMGATVPIVFHELKRDLKNVGRHSGLLFSLNTVGSLTGSLIGGIVFFYFFNIPTVFMITIFLAAVSTCLSARSKQYATAGFVISGIAILFAVITPYYEKERFSVGTFRTPYLSKISFYGPQNFFQHFFKAHNILFYEDGPTGTVAVGESEKKELTRKSRAIYVNGKSDSSTGGKDLYTLKLLAHIPALLAEKRKDALVIGLGTGVTAGELTLYPDVENIDVAEISPSVVKAFPLFGESTHQAHLNPKVKLHIADAFRVLGRSSKKWDIVISEPSNPWVMGVDMLFTQEFYALVKQHLHENGVFMQWVNGYSFNSELLGMVINTLRHEFTESRVFISNEGDLLILCTNKSIHAADIKKAAATLKGIEPVRESLKVIKMDEIENILLREVLTPSYIHDNFYNAGIQAMDNPRLHYLAGKAFFMGESVNNDVFFNYKTASYTDEYLFSKFYDNRKDCSFSEEKFQNMLTSLKYLDGDYLPIALCLKIKAYLCNPDTYRLSQEDKKTVKVELLSSLAGNSEASSLKDKSMRYKVGALTDYMRYSRSWLAPYPIDGLKNLLKQGISSNEKENDRNLYAIQLIQIFAEEKARQDTIENILAKLIRNKAGKIMLDENDEELLKQVGILLKETYNIDIP